jgi:hypothetical protein
MVVKIQSIIFDKRNGWTPFYSKRWLARNKKFPIKKVHKTLNFLRYRLQDPDLFKSFRLKKIGDGIELVLGIF